MTEFTSIYRYPSPIADRNTKPSDLVLLAVATFADLSDEEKSMLEPWVPQVLESARKRSPKQLSDALARIDYLRLEQFRCGIADQATTEWEMHLTQEEFDVLVTPLPAKMDREAKNRLLEVLRYIKRLDVENQRFEANRKPAGPKRHHKQRSKQLANA